MFTISFRFINELRSKDSFKNYTSANLHKMRPICGGKTIWFGFLGYGTREALFGLNVLLQKCRDQSQNLCFIDYEKAFDRVKHTELINLPW